MSGIFKSYIVLYSPVRMMHRSYICGDDSL